MATTLTTIQLPLTGIKPLYRDDEQKTLVIEVKLDMLKAVNEPETLDEIISQARLDYAKGDYSP